VFADVGVWTDASAGGAEAVAAGQPGLDQRESRATSSAAPERHPDRTTPGTTPVVSGQARETAKSPPATYLALRPQATQRPTAIGQTQRAGRRGSQARARRWDAGTLAPPRKAGASSAPARTTACRPNRACRAGLRRRSQPGESDGGAAIGTTACRTPGRRDARPEERCRPRAARAYCGRGMRSRTLGRLS
jgi:hypothetical protein